MILGSRITDHFSAKMIRGSSFLRIIPTPAYGWRRAEVLENQRLYQTRMVLADIGVGFCIVKGTSHTHCTAISAYFLTMGDQKAANSVCDKVTS